MNDVPISGEKDPRRPLGLVVVVCLFIAFAVVDVAAQLVRANTWWAVSLCMSALLIFLFRRLWFGDERERKIGVLFGFFVAALDLFAMPDVPLQEWPPEEYLGVLEGTYALGAAFYLMLAKRDPFFASNNVP